MSLMTNPYNSEMPATTICAMNLLRGRIPMMSSQMPTIKISVAPKSMPMTS